MANFVTAEEAVSKIADGAVIATSGFVGAIVAEHVLNHSLKKGLLVI